MEHTIELKYGYKEKGGEVHRSVTFGKRLSLQDIIDLDNNPQAQNPTQYQRLIRRLMITKFGKLIMPVALQVLLALDTFDDDLLTDGADQFLRLSRADLTGEIREADTKLMFGIDVGGINYDLVQFGNRLTVQDYVEADRLKLGDGVAREAHKVGRQIIKLSSTEHSSILDGPRSVEELSKMDSEDFNILRLAAEFFRIGLSGDGKKPAAAENDTPSGERNGVDRAADPAAAAGAV